MRRRRGVVFHGFYGQRNAGDDAFARIASGLAEELGLKDPSFTAWPGAFAELGVRGSAAFPARVRFPGQLRMRVAAASIAARSSVLLGGSTLFQKQRSLDDQLLLARTRQVRLHACGVSVGPFATTEHESAVARYLRACETIAVRDMPSYDRASALVPDREIFAGYDLAILLPELNRTPALGEGSIGARQTIGVSVCSSSSRGGDESADSRRLAATLRLVDQAVRQTGCKVRVVVMNGHPEHGDARISASFAAALEPTAEVEIVPYSANTAVLAEAVAGCSAVVAMRLHAAVFAYASRVPVLMAGYHPKNGDFAATVGYPECATIDISGSGSAAGRDLQTLLAMLDRRDWDSYMPRVDVEEGRRIAQQSLGPLKRALSR